MHPDIRHSSCPHRVLRLGPKSSDPSSCSQPPDASEPAAWPTPHCLALERPYPCASNQLQLKHAGWASSPRASSTTPGCCSGHHRGLVRTPVRSLRVVRPADPPTGERCSFQHPESSRHATDSPDAAAQMHCEVRAQVSLPDQAPRGTSSGRLRGVLQPVVRCRNRLLQPCSVGAKARAKVRERSCRHPAGRQPLPHPRHLRSLWLACR